MKLIFLKFVILFFNLSLRTDLINPIELLSPFRLDVAAKYTYVKYKELGVKSNFHIQLYRNHLRALNNFFEENPRKTCFEDFKQSFDNLIESIKKNGFNSKISSLIVAEDDNQLLGQGVHRLATSLYFNQKVVALPLIGFNKSKLLKENNNFYTYKLFLKNNLPEKYLDFMALKYCELDIKSFLVFIFPCVTYNLSKIEEILNEYSIIGYKKLIKLVNNGPMYFLECLYKNNGWNNFSPGAIEKVNSCFPIKSNLKEVKVYLVSSVGLDNMIKAKNKIRNFYKTHHVIHVTDTHEEAVIAARMVLNNNSLHFINNRKKTYFKNFEAFFKSYKRVLNCSKVDQECFCIDASAVLSAYGLRDCNDLDVLHHGYDAWIKSSFKKDIGSHNTELHHHVFKLDDIIFDPDNYFYYDGFKFAFLNVIKSLKKKRNELKDINDIKLINLLF